MGLPGVAIKITEFMAIITSLIDMLGHVKAVAATSFARLGLLNLAQDEIPDHDHERAPLATAVHSIIVMDGLSPTLVNVPIRVLTSLIKDRVPVLEYGTYLEKSGAGEEGGNAAACAVCLGGVERRDEIRELCNCSHVFHRECLDCWVDEDQVTCPLCRALLFPVSWDDWRNSWGGPSKQEMNTADFLGEEPLASI